MTSIYRTVDVIVIALGVSVICFSLKMRYWAEYSPGPGFFPLWLGILLIFLAAIDIIGTFRRPPERLPKGIVPDQEGMRRLLLILGALLATLLLMKPLGFNVSILLFSIFLLWKMGKHSWWLTVLVSIIGSFGTFFLFQELQVFLPRGFLGF